MNQARPSFAASRLVGFLAMQGPLSDRCPKSTRQAQQGAFAERLLELAVAVGSAASAPKAFAGMRLSITNMHA